MTLSKTEKKILQVIQKHFPISWDEVIKIYKDTGCSFDDTIRVFQQSARSGLDPLTIWCIIKDSRRFTIYPDTT